MEKFLFTSESVTEGHPDKVCDQISDAVLDAILEKDPQAHVACEEMCIRDSCNAVPIQLPIGSEDTFRGIIDLVEMKADVYYDDMGKDMRVEDIPEDMKLALIHI